MVRLGWEKGNQKLEASEDLKKKPNQQSAKWQGLNRYMFFLLTLHHK